VRRWLARLVSLVTVASALAMTAAPTAAARATFDDRVKDAPRGMDIRSIRVVNEQRVNVRTEFRYLKNRSVNSIASALYIDTKRRNHGPEFVMSGTMFFEVYFYRTKGWQGPSEFLDCDVRGRATDGRFGNASFSFARRCLGRPDEVRVAAVSGFPREHD
jgi:hypothetical protein